MTVRYGLASDSWDLNERQAIQRVLDSGRLTMGFEVDAFENEFAEFLGVKHAVMVNSGSSANLIGVASLVWSGVSSPGVVVVPAVSWSTTYFPWVQHRYKLRFVDVDPDTLNYDVRLLRKAMTADVTAVCAVNLLGNPASINEVASICDEYGVPLLEDNCESFGAEVSGKKAGTFGVLGTHSFFFSHHLQTMEGGMLSTNDDHLASVARSLRAHGWSRDRKSGSLSSMQSDEFGASFEFLYPGYCVRPVEFMGATGREQLRKWPSLKAWREKNAERFTIVLSRYANILRIQSPGGRQGVSSSWFGFSLICIGFAAGKRDLLKKIFDDFGIESRPIVAGNFCRQPVIKLIDSEVFSPLIEADKVHFDGLFIGNDGRDLACELDVLSEALTVFASDLGHMA